MNTNTESQQTFEHGGTRFMKLISGAGSAILGVALVAAAILASPPRGNAAPTVSATDAAFIQAAAQDGMTEVKLGEMAAQKGTRADVKEFGKKMVKDHTAINDDLRALSAQKGLSLTDTLDAKHQGKFDKMAALSDAEFDDAYIAAMVKGHKGAVKEFKAEAASTQDSDIKSFLDKSLPVVEEHLKHITSMKK